MLAVGATLVSIKPQIAIAFAAAVVASLALRKDVRGMALATASVTLVTLAADLIHPFPVVAFLGAGGERAAYDLSTTGALARDLGDGVVLTGALILTSGASVAAALGSSARRHGCAIALCALLGMSLVVAPYAHTYDQLLALPAAFAAVALARGSRAEPVVAGVAIVLWLVLPWVLFLWWPLLGEWSRFHQGGPLGAVPIVSLAGLALVAWVSRAAAARGGARA